MVDEFMTHTVKKVMKTAYVMIQKEHFPTKMVYKYSTDESIL